MLHVYYEHDIVLTVPCNQINQILMLNKLYNIFIETMTFNHHVYTFNEIPCGSAINKYCYKTQRI